MNDEIITYRETHTLSETGEKFGLSPERIRQILLLKDRKRCERHNRFYYNACSYCLSDSYYLYLQNLSDSQILLEVRREAQNRRRDWLSTQRRVSIVRILHDDYGVTFSELGRLLKRDTSTLNYLYHEHVK